MARVSVIKKAATENGYETPQLYIESLIHKGKSLKDIATKLGVSYNSVWLTLHRRYDRKKLRPKTETKSRRCKRCGEIIKGANYFYCDSSQNNCHHKITIRIGESETYNENYIIEKDKIERISEMAQMTNPKQDFLMHKLNK